MAKRERKNRTRRDKHSLAKYGNNPRRIQQEHKTVSARLIYACNLLFGGSTHEFAAAAGVCYRHLYKVVYGHSRLTVNMAAQIVARVGIRAEWLLCGVGSVLATPESAEDGLILPPKINSTFRPFDATAYNPGTEFFPPEQILLNDVPVHDLAPYKDAAGAIFAAHANSKPVGFFLGNEAFAAPAAQLVLPFFTERYADFLVLTLSAAAHDIQAAQNSQPIDINTVARFAAARGIGYGEAIGLAGFSPDIDRQKSLLASMRDIHLPALVSAEIGELGRHTTAPVRGAEIGACIGAAAYVDLLIYTEQLRNFFGTPGGVMIVAGECQRGVRMFLERFEALKLVEPVQTGFTFVLFSQPDNALQTDIQIRGGHVIFLDQPTITPLRQLFQTCNDVYAGKINHEQRKSHSNIV